jgi:hypothetical protein
MGRPFFNSVHCPVEFQIVQLTLVQAQHVVALVEMTDEGSETYRLGDEGRQCRACDTEPRDGTDAEDEYRVQDDVDADRQQHEVEGRLGIPRAAQHRHHEGIQIQERQREEDDTHVGHGEDERVGRGAHGNQQRT